MAQSFDVVVADLLIIIDIPAPASLFACCLLLILVLLWMQNRTKSSGYFNFWRNYCIRDLFA
jgi:hypothetical protein